jgi:hypothetical protein
MRLSPSLRGPQYVEEDGAGFDDGRWRSARRMAFSQYPSVVAYRLQ